MNFRLAVELCLLDDCSIHQPLCLTKYLKQIQTYYIFTAIDPASASTTGPTPRKGRFFILVKQD